MLPYTVSSFLFVLIGEFFCFLLCKHHMMLSVCSILMLFTCVSFSYCVRVFQYFLFFRSSPTWTESIKKVSPKSSTSYPTTHLKRSTRQRMTSCTPPTRHRHLMTWVSVADVTDIACYCCNLLLLLPLMLILLFWCSCCCWSSLVFFFNFQPAITFHTSSQTTFFLCWSAIEMPRLFTISFKYIHMSVKISNLQQ